MKPSATRVARRWVLKKTAQRVVSAPLSRRARRSKGAAQVRRELTAEALEAFGEAALDSGVKVASIGSKLKELWEVFQSAPQKWEEFKKMLGIRTSGTIGAMRELPRKIREMISKSRKALFELGSHLREKIPLLKLYLDVGVKLPSVGDWLQELLGFLPAPIQKAVQTISSKVRSLAEWIDELLKKHRALKPLGILLSAGIFTIIWFNVVEISWDLPEILRGFLGGYSFVELLHSLPESALGFLLNLMFPGIPGSLVLKTLFPITIALRLAWLIHKDYVEWVPGREFKVRWDKLGVQPPARFPSSVKV